MHNLPGNPDALRASAGDLGRFVVAYQALEIALTEVIDHADEAGNFSGGRAMRQVAVAMRTSARDAIGKLNDVKGNLESTATRLEGLEASVQRMTAIPTVAGSMLANEYLRQSHQARSDLAAVMLRCLPSGVTGRQVEYPGLGTTIKHVYERGIKEPVEGVIGLVTFGLSISPARAALDPAGYARTMDGIAQNGVTLWNAVVNDTFPDGSKGAREFVKNELSQIPGAMLNEDLIDTDPAAWWILYGATALSMLVGAGEAKAGTSLITSLRKGVDQTADLGKLGHLVGPGAAKLTGGDSAMSRLLQDYPDLLARMERPVGDVPSGIFESKVRGDYSGRLKIEELVLALTKGESPGMVQLKPGHDVIDLMDVSLVDPSTGRIISVKSLDPALSSYQASPSKVGSTLVTSADKLRNWATRGNSDGTGTAFIKDHDAFGDLDAANDTVFFMGDDLITRDLYFALPEDGLNAAQAASLQQAIAQIEKTNADSGITINVHLLEVSR